MKCLCESNLIKSVFSSWSLETCPGRTAQEAGSDDSLPGQGRARWSSELALADKEISTLFFSKAPELQDALGVRVYSSEPEAVSIYATAVCSAAERPSSL